jgi:hypothetical protein
MNEQEIKKRYLEIIKTIVANARPESYTLDQLRCANQILMYGANTTHLKGSANSFGMDEGWKVDYYPASFLGGEEN